MQYDTTPSFLLALQQRFQLLIWSCLDADLGRSAGFYAERYYSIDRDNHDARHLYATSLLKLGQPHSALHLVNTSPDGRCGGCSEIKYRCCTVLGRHRQAREALLESLSDPQYTSSLSNMNREARVFPDEAIMHCRAGNMALKGNLRDQAGPSFRRALALNPLLWEAFEGLCALGTIPEIQELFPAKPPPVKRAPPMPPEDLQKRNIPLATGVGFFTPEVGTAGGLFRQTQPFRLGGHSTPREGLGPNDTFNVENSMLHAEVRPSRQPPPQASQPNHPPMSRPLSSADESGPVQKKLRSGTLQRAGGEAKSPKPSDDRSKKARARPALILANFFSSSGRNSQSKTTHTRNASGALKSDREQSIGTRRSTRLLSGSSNKSTHAAKSSLPRRRQAHTRTRSTESEMDDDQVPEGPAYSTSPPSIARSPISDTSPAPSTWTAADEQAAQEAFDIEQADEYIYNLMRLIASATRALALYDMATCLKEIDKLPHVHQRSGSVMVMVGKCHYELTEYATAERSFDIVRELEPYRVWDMEVYSTLLWHLRREVQLSFLAQELLATDSRSPEAWIAVGNCFSQQKEKAEALTCFRRAVQLDPTCAYAFTLSGHEIVDDDTDKAMSFFQSALHADPRSYNAWYGLGVCYLRKNKLRVAEYHFRKALEIHPNNAVLLGCVAVAIERRGDRDTALALYEQAVRTSPDNALVRYRRAKILIAKKRYKRAAEDLEYLRDLTPEESNVIFQLAKVYRLLGDELKAAQLLAVARDLSPKSVNKIKKLIDTVKDEEAVEEEMDEG
ncbi:TPR-like protein [Neolentinus lepideus HHB14362 ss-1]|uniref:TPR-like protein n=1 Tax=Neolentinus lepideus HHB14362 ss-1 TaxID=1314782 RepID=A0A165UQT5_9AGAM|nr:TPR-like protein [Neolentinus lepideus HHB14362 ss-1]